MTEIHIEYRADGFYYWYLISEFNNHVIAQGKARSDKTALKQVQEAQWSFLETVNS